MTEFEGAEAWRTPPGRYLAERPPMHDGHRLSSRYVEVRDGTRLAIDVYLPGPAGDGPFPVVCCFTPYYRRFKLRAGSRGGGEASPNLALYRDTFVPRGYALVGVDVRGTGASFGARDGFRSPRERLDHHDVVDWVARQPWCDGSIGATGISYLGAASDFLASTDHPAVKAVAPLFSVWDTWSNHLYPGGVLCNCISRNYGALADALDQDRRDELRQYAYFKDPNLTGPAPVDDDPAGEFLAQALLEHRGNFDMQDFAQQFRFRDDALTDDPDYTSAKIGPYHYANRAADASTAYLSVTGWYDGGGFSLGGLQRHTWLENPAKRLLVGPWDHGARTHASPWRKSAGTPQRTMIAEVLRFFDHHLMGRIGAIEDEAPVHFYTMGAERWQAAEHWPPPGVRTLDLFAAEEGALQPALPTADGGDDYQADYDCRSGRHSRYDRIYAADVPVYYDDWAGRDEKMLCYTAAPFDADTEVTGHPSVSLHFSCSERDCAFFVYLEDVTPEGRAVYVTEGVFRALHRAPGAEPETIPALVPTHSFARDDARHLTPGEPAEADFGLLPVSYLFRRGHRLRLAIALADSDHFSRIPDGRPPQVRILRGPATPTRLGLPIRR